MSNPRDNRKTIVRTLSRTVDNTVLLALLVILILACYALWDAHQLSSAADAERYTSYKPTADDQLSFEELRALNSDVIGWLTVYDTRIDYPVLRSPKTNDDYLSKNALGEWEGSGSLFLDHNNRADFSDFNTIIYGHHMTERKMFGDLDLFVKQNYFNEHQYANLYFDGANHGLEIFAILTIDAYHPIASSPNITDSIARQELLNSILNEAVQKRDIGVTTNDHIIIMTTCNLSETNGRYTLVAKLLDHEVVNPFPEEEEETRTGTGSLNVFSIVDRFAQLTIWQWILLLIILICIIWLLYKAERKRLLRKKERKLAKESEKAEPTKD